MDVQAHRKQRLRELMALRCDNTIARLAEKIERAESYVSRMLYPMDKPGAKPIADKMSRVIESAFNLERAWLDMPLGHGLQVQSADSTPKTAELVASEQVPAYLRAAQAQSNAAAAEVNLADNPEYPAIRRVRFKLSAGASGFGIEYLDEPDEAPIVFRRSWFESHGYRPHRLFAFRVANGSMESGLYDGDTVVVNTDATTPKDGVVYAFNYEGELVVKRLIRDSGQWWLYSDNPDQRRYPPKLCDENCHIIGQIVHKQSERI